MSKNIFNENLLTLGLPDRAAFNALIELTPATVPYKDEMVEVLESISKTALIDFIDAPHPTELALAFKLIRAD